MTYATQWVGAVFFTKGREAPVRRIVLHWMATNLAGCDATFLGGQRQASAHYGLEDTKRHQYVAKTDTAWHSGVRAINHESIGVEHSAQPGRDATEATILNSIDLCTELCREFGLTADAIDQHNDFYATQCPGTLPVKRIREAVRANLAPKEDDVTPDDIKAIAKATGDEVWKRPVDDGQGGRPTTGAAIGYALRNSIAAVRALEALAENLPEEAARAVLEALGGTYDATVELTPKES